MKTIVCIFEFVMRDQKSCITKQITTDLIPIKGDHVELHDNWIQNDFYSVVELSVVQRKPVYVGNVVSCIIFRCDLIEANP